MNHTLLTITTVFLLAVGLEGRLYQHPITYMPLRRFVNNVDTEKIMRNQQLIEIPLQISPLGPTSKFPLFLFLLLLILL